MNPFYFGSSDRPLFGIYHPPSSDTVRSGGVVLCPAIGQDYMRTHRGLKQLASQLAKAGFPVLRFDYFGTGDSGGESDAGTVDQWLEDIETAVQELKDTADVESVSLVGLRIGATLAARAATRRSDVDRVILWDPVLDGEDYVDAMIRIAHDSGEHPVGGPNETVGVYGFPLTRALREGLSGVDLLNEGTDTEKVSFLVVSDEDAGYDRLRTSLPEAAGFAHVPTLSDWNDVERIGAMLLPQQIILTIVEHMTRDA